MSDKIEYSRLLIKRSAESGTIPTIPTGTTLNTFTPTDIFTGELFLNTADDNLWVRTDTGILQILNSGYTSSIFATGFTYSNNTLTISNNNGSSLNTTINTFTGLTINGAISATTISGGTLYGDGSNLTGVSSSFTGNTSGDCITDFYVTDIYGCGNNVHIELNDPLYATGFTVYNTRLGEESRIGNLGNNSFIQTSDGTNIGSLNINSSTSSISSSNGGDTTQLELTPTTMTIYSTGGLFSGLTYDVNYSANFTNRSLVDKEYVDNLTFSGGSGNCITDLYVTNIHGCSPITFFDNLQTTDSSASGLLSTAFGYQTTASGDYSYSQNYLTIASGDSSHAEGEGTTASGIASHAEGSGTIASANYSHSEGNATIASGYTSHAEGIGTIAGGDYSHAEGSYTIADGYSSHAEGEQSISSGNTSHAEGYQTIAGGDYSHAEGNGTIALGLHSHSQGYLTVASGDESFAGGYNSTASGVNSFIHSVSSIVTADRAVVLGGQNITGATNDTVYVPYLNIKDVPTGTSINNLGIDINGNVIIGSTGSTPTLANVLLAGNTAGDTDIIMGASHYIRNYDSTANIRFTDNIRITNTDGSINTNGNFDEVVITFETNDGTNLSNISIYETNINVTSDNGSTNSSYTYMDPTTYTLSVGDENYAYTAYTKFDMTPTEIKVTSPTFTLESPSIKEQKGTANTTTSTNTQTTLTEFDGSTYTDQVIMVKCKILGVKSDGSLGYNAEHIATFLNQAGTVGQIGTIETFVRSSFTTATSTISTTGTDIRIRVTGESATTINWKTIYEITV